MAGLTALRLVGTEGEVPDDALVSFARSSRVAVTG
jgi:hypothetical protein